MEFALLGPLEVWDADHRQVRLGGSKRRALLALLLLNANEVVRTERLAEELWGEHAPGNAVGSIHNHVSRLRKELGPEVLVTHRWGYALRADPETIDVFRFERAVAQADALPAAGRAARLAEALSLWRGAALADLVGEPSLARHIERLEERRLVALERRIDADLETGRSGDLVVELEALIAGNPLREHFRWQLILALYRCGRQAEALEVYRETRRLLVEELGLEPGPELRALESAILRHDPALAAPAAEHLPAGPAEPTLRARRRVYAALAGLVLAAGTGGGAYLLVQHLRHTRVATAHTVSGARRDTGSPVVHVTTHGPRGQSVSARRPQRPSSRRLRLLHASPATAGHPPPAARPSPSPARTTPALPTTAATTGMTRGTHVRRQIGPTTTSAPPAAGTATTTVATTTTAPSTTATITTSAGPAVPTLEDRTAWWTSSNQSVLTVTRSPGRVTIAVPSDATDGFNASVTTRCRVVGDFDARVSFDLATWPGSDGIWVSLMAADLGGVNTYRTDAFGETYGTYVPPNSGPPPVPASGASGALRLTRQGSLITGSYLAGSTWVAIASQSGPTAGTEISLAVFNGSDVEPFGGQAATVSFSDFTLVAQRLDC